MNGGYTACLGTQALNAATRFRYHCISRMSDDGIGIFSSFVVLNAKRTMPQSPYAFRHIQRWAVVSLPFTASAHSWTFPHSKICEGPPSSLIPHQCLSFEAQQEKCVPLRWFTSLGDTAFAGISLKTPTRSVIVTPTLKSKR